MVCRSDVSLVSTATLPCRGEKKSNEIRIKALRSDVMMGVLPHPSGWKIPGVGSVIGARVSM